MNNQLEITPKQLQILRLLYRFRFCTARLIAENGNITNRAANLQLTALLKSSAIKRQYGGTQRLNHEEAVYSLDAAGRTVLARDPRYSKKVLGAIRTNKPSKRFIQHSLTLFSIYHSLRKEYGNELVFLTKSNLAQEKFDYLSAARPDSLISIPREKDYFFLYLLDESKPMFALTHQIARVLSYKKAGTWQDTTHTPFPTVILTCRTKQQETMLQKRLRYLCREYDVEIRAVLIQLTHIEEPVFTWHQQFKSKEFQGYEMRRG